MRGRGAAGEAKGRHVPAYSGSIGQKAQLASAYAELGKELLSTQLRVVGNYTLGRVIGEGSFGKVRLGVHRLTGTRVAIKHIPKSSSPPLLTREIHHHRRLHHPCVVQLYEIIATEHSIWLVTELCAGGELFDYLVEKGRLTEHEVRKIFGQLCLGMGYVHREGVVHRDLKLENVLLDERCNAKVADFGFGREFEQRKLMETYCGTTGYAAPEMLAGRKYFGEEVDIWSMGIILYTLLAGSLPFDDDDEDVMKEKIIRGDYVLPDFLSREARDLISQILQPDPKGRPSIEKILAHRWFTVPAALHDFDGVFPPSPAFRHDTIAEEESPLPSSSAGATSPLADPFESHEHAPAPVSSFPEPDSSADSHDASPHLAASSATGLGILSESEISEQSSTGASDLSLQGSSSRSGATSPVTSEDTPESSHAEDAPTPTTASAEVGPSPVGAGAKLRLQHGNGSQSTIRKPHETTVGKGKRRQASQTLPTHTEGDVVPSEDAPPSTPGFQFPLMPSPSKKGVASPAASSDGPSSSAMGPNRTGGSLKRRSVSGSPAFYNSPSVGTSRTPSRTKRRSIGSNISERMLPLDDSSFAVAPFDYVSALRNAPHGPPLSTAEDDALLATLDALGFDIGQMSHSVKTNACDASGAIWWLLKRKVEAKDGDRVAPGATPVQSFAKPHRDERAKAKDAIDPSKQSSDVESGKTLSAPTAALAVRRPSPEGALETAPPLGHPSSDPPSSQATTGSRQTTNASSTPPSSADYFTAWGEGSERSDHTSSKDDTVEGAPPGTPPATSAALSAATKDLDATPTACSSSAGTPTSATPKSPDRKRSQSVSMLQRATSALAAKKSDEGNKLGKGKQKETISEADEVATKKESRGGIPKNLEEVNRSGSNLPLAALFSRRTVSDTRTTIDRVATPTKQAHPSSPERPSMSLPASPIKLHGAMDAARRGSDPSGDGHPVPAKMVDIGDRRPTMSSSGTYETLSTIAGDDESTAKPSKPNRARVNLFSTFRLWFNEDRRKRKRKVSGSGGAYAQTLNRSTSGHSAARSRQGSVAAPHRQGEANLPRPSPVVRQASSGSRRSSFHSSRRVSLDLNPPPRSRRRSDSSRASFGSHTGSKTPTSEHGSMHSTSARRSSDQTRRGHGHTRQPSTGSSHSRRSNTHLSPSQPYRRAPSGTTVRRITTSTHGSRPNLHPRSQSQASSARVSISSDDEDAELHFGNSYDVEETIVEEAEGAEDDERASSERARALRKLSGEVLRAGSGDGGSSTGDRRDSKSSSSQTTATTIFTAHKNYNVFGTPTAAARSSWGRAAAHGNGNGAGGQQSSSTSRPRLRDVFARPSDDGEWVDEDDDPLASGRYSGGLGQSAFRSEGKPSSSAEASGAPPHTPPVSSTMDVMSGNTAGAGLLGEGRYAGLSSGRADAGGWQRPAQRARGSAFKGTAIVEEEEEEE